MPTTYRDGVPPVEHESPEVPSAAVPEPVDVTAPPRRAPKATPEVKKATRQARTRQRKATRKR